MQIGLDAVKVGQQTVVAKLQLAQTLQERLASFGVIPGTVLRVRYKSPDLTVTALEFRGTVVAMRTRDLGGIRVVC